MCTIWAPKAQFFGHFGPQSKSKFWSLVTFSKSFHLFHISIASHAHCKNCQRCVKYGPQRPNFGAILGPLINKNSGLWSLSQKVFTGFTPIFLHMLIASTFKCVDNMGRIFGPLWTNSSLWSFSQKFSTGFTQVLLCLSI